MGSLFASGIVHAENPGGSSGGGLNKIYRTVCSGGEQQFTIPVSGSLDSTQYGLLINVIARAANWTSSVIGMVLRFNGDTGFNYQYAEFYARSPNITGVEGWSGSGSNDRWFFLGTLNRSDNPAGLFSFAQVWIPFPFTTDAWKIVEANIVHTLDADVVSQIMHIYGHWRNTAAITSLNISARKFTGNGLLPDGLAAGSIVEVWQLTA